MSYTARVLSMGGNIMHEPWGQLDVEEMSWTAMGGCEKAVLRLADPAFGVEAWQSYLGNPIHIFDEWGELQWWGWLAVAEQSLPGMRLLCDLEKMANRVAVVYRSLEPGEAFGETRQTAWVDDFESQALYGVKENLVMAGAMSAQEAEHWRDLELSRWRLPVLQVIPEKADEQGVRLIAKGWHERLNWRVWQRESGVIGNAVSQSGTQILGSDVHNAQIAQSFKIKRGGQLSAIALRLRKHCTPTDKLRVDIRADQNGSPGSVNLSSCLVDIASLSADSYAWSTGVFQAPINLLAEAVYWFVISRTGALDGNAYAVLALDENLNYPDGQMKLYQPSDQSWVARSPAADALFKITLLTRVEDEINAMISLSDGIIQGSTIETSIALRLPLTAVRGKKLLDALRELLEMGTLEREKLLMEISPSRVLRIFAEPDQGHWAYILTDAGVLFDTMGRELCSVKDLIGQRVRIQWGQSFLVGEVSLNAHNGQFRLKAF